jgi:hypothetical protein
MSCSCVFLTARLPPSACLPARLQPADAPLVSSEVLVETFEEGELISSYVGTTGPHNKKLADLGLHCYLKMLLKDNFIHADLVSNMHEMI